MTVATLGLFGLVFCFSFGLTRLLCSPGSGLTLLDHPSERSLHTAPIPRTGGLAIFGSVMVGLLLSLVIEWFGTALWRKGLAVQAGAWLWILGVTLIIWTVSFWDDRAGLSPGLRLGIHALAAAGVVGGAGLTMRTVPIPLLGALSLGWTAVPVTVLCLIWMTNLYNFMDGMDGFAGGMTVVGYSFLGYLAWKNGNQWIAFLCFLIAAASGGFLYYNLPPARIFMGDLGSVSLGFLAGALALWGVRERLFDLWAPVLIFSPFIVDATVTLFRRLLRGEKVWHAHREHYYQRVVIAGWGHRKTVFAEYALMLACGLSAVVYGYASEAGRLAILAGWALAYAGLAYGVRLVERGAQTAHP